MSFTVISYYIIDKKQYKTFLSAFFLNKKRQALAYLFNFVRFFCLLSFDEFKNDNIAESSYYLKK